MRYNNKYTAIFSEQGKIAQEILFLACDIKDNQNKLQQFHIFGIEGMAYPIAYTDQKQMHDFIEMLANSANGLKCGQMRFNDAARKNILFCTQDNYKAKLLQSSEYEPQIEQIDGHGKMQTYNMGTIIFDKKCKNKTEYPKAHTAKYFPLEDYEDFGVLCQDLIEEIVDNNTNLCIIENCTDIDGCTNNEKIKTLAGIAEVTGCCIFAGFNVSKSKISFFDTHRQSAIYLQNEKIGDNNATAYIYDNGARMGAISTDTEGNIIFSRLTEQYVMQNFLPIAAQNPVTTKDLQNMLFGYFEGNKSMNTIYQALARAKSRKIIVDIENSHHRYVFNNGEKSPKIKVDNIAFSALSDAQRYGKRKRVPIVQFGEYRNIIENELAYNSTEIDTIDILMSAIICGKYQNLFPNKNRKRILFITDIEGDIAIRTQKLCNLTKQKSLQNFIAYEIHDIAENIDMVEKYIQEHTPDYIFLQVNSNNAIEMDNIKTNTLNNNIIYQLAKKYDSAIFAVYFTEDWRIHERLTQTTNEIYWSVSKICKIDTDILAVFIGIYKGNPFKNFFVITKDRQIRKPKYREISTALLEYEFNWCKHTKIEEITDAVTDRKISKKELKKAEELGIIRIDSETIIKDRSRHVQKFATYIKPIERILYKK